MFFTWHPEKTATFWLLAEYLPAAAQTHDRHAVPVEVLTGLLPDAALTVQAVPVPHDCLDGFGAAYWRRPQAYLDPHIRAGISMLAGTDEDALEPGLARLDHDIRTGRWAARHAALLELEALDVGYCTVVADL